MSTLDIAMWLGAGVGAMLLVAVVWDYLDYERVKRKDREKWLRRKGWERVLRNCEPSLCFCR